MSTPRIITKQSDLTDESVTMADLVASYNALTGESVARFSSVAAGRVRVSNAILAAQDRAGHAGVQRHSTPEAVLASEQSSRQRDTTTTEEVEPEEKETDMARKIKSEAGGKKPSKTAAKKAPSKTAAKKAPSKTSKAPAEKKAPTPRGGRTSIYNHVKYTEPDVPRRPQAASNRTKVLEALRKRKSTTIEQLSTDVGFDARSYVHKLAGQGWCEVIASPKQ